MALANAKLPDTSLARLPLVSVIVPIYNGEADLPGLLQCLQAQTYPAARVEYLLVDNGSSDRTLELLELAASQFSQTEIAPAVPAIDSQTDHPAHPIEEPAWHRRIQLRVLSETQIQSSYAARNCGIRAAIGEILAFTDADCRPQPDWLLHLVQPFQQAGSEKIGIVAGEILPLPGTSLLERYADRHQILSQCHTLSHSFYSYGQTANLAVRRQALEQAGLFRPWLTTGGDADLCWRIQQQGFWQLQFAEQAIVQHRHRSTWRELRHQWTRYGRSNCYLHELHGVALAQPLTRRETFYRLSRWLLKEIPIVLRQTVTEQGFSSLKRSQGESWIDAVMDTPIGLLCRHWRTIGQQESALPEAACQVEWFPQTATVQNL
ncbi:glycosyltransferase [Leptolyngbya sp. FACHB-711]|uniref:glycosyltransferase n=1 Tax=unclassified Leptolyngbya TaxID=2650499 RepID=UPI001686EBAF|nr:glycosyltransferase [Leptolyngbya sp. FACHB-711]MBD1850513.1 glycosyltransferase [Cyanobacteria bacterium FACHB-502]MBD2023859.1 glycosyltransferase [Leptolyngbya sp. FACHB-711]